MSPSRDESLPLLPLPVTSPSPSQSPPQSSSPSTATSPSISTSPTSSHHPPRRLQARRLLSEKARGKQRAVASGDPEAQSLLLGSTDGLGGRGEGEEESAVGARTGMETNIHDSTGINSDDNDASRAHINPQHERGRHVIVIFSNESSGGGNLELWVENGESVGAVKDQIRHLRPSLAPLSLRLIHSGRLLTDGILLLPWLRSLEDRVRRQASGVGADVESVLKDVGLAEEDDDGDDEGQKGARGGGKAEEKVWLHCNVGGRMDAVKRDEGEVEPAAPRRRGFDVLLDAGLSPEDVTLMRRQFYESRGEEMPEGMESGDVNDEHARALEEQWIEGDLTADTAITSTEGLYSSILQGLLTGFLFPFYSLFFLHELPLPNFFDAEAEAASSIAAAAAAVKGSGQRHADATARGTTTRDDADGDGLGESGVLGLTPSTTSPANAPTTTTTTSATTPAATAISQGGTLSDTGLSARDDAAISIADRRIEGVVFSRRVVMGIFMGTVFNILFGAMRFLN